MQDFRKLKVWERSHQLTLLVYRATASFPQSETYGLVSQIRRSCSSIPANIAEGCGRTGNAEFGRFLSIAQGSASELEYHLLLAHDLSLLPTQEYEQIAADVTEVRRMLAGLMQRLKNGSQ